ncbi:MAG: universal stress protein [Proteobacteria bacterium]|nr:universal stress protein [Pseudomonadota bacterium]
MSKSKSGPVDVACLIRAADEMPVAAMKQAIALAAETGAHLSAIIGVQVFTAPYTPFWTSMSASIAAEVNQKSKAKADSFAETFKADAKAAGVDLDIAVVSGPFGDVAEKAAFIARTADIVVIDQPHGALDTTEMLLEEALFHSGRPVLIASPRRAPVGRVTKAVVGWDGSSHAVRAVSDAIDAFPALETIEIVTVSGEKDLSGALPAADFARHLARKGLKVTLSDVPRAGKSVAAVLDSHAQASGADILITGGFGHSRLREFLLGGVTVELTQNAVTPLLMAY